MSWTEEGKIAVGETAYSFVVYWDDRAEQECVKLHTGDLSEYITQFQNVKEMKEFLNHADPDEVNSQLDKILKFRRFCKEQLEDWENVKKIHGALDEGEKGDNIKVFMQRLQMLCGDMPVRQFAWILGLNEGTTYNLIRGQRTPGGHIFKRIADKTGMSADWLIGRK